jgi:hypothetical protein
MPWTCQPLVGQQRTTSPSVPAFGATGAHSYVQGGRWMEKGQGTQRGSSIYHLMKRTHCDSTTSTTADGYRVQCCRFCFYYSQLFFICVSTVWRTVCSPAYHTYKYACMCMYMQVWQPVQMLGSTVAGFINGLLGGSPGGPMKLASTQDAAPSHVRSVCVHSCEEQMGSRAGPAYAFDHQGTYTARACRYTYG